MAKTQVNPSVAKLQSYFDEADLHILFTDLLTKKGWLLRPGMQRIRQALAYKDVPRIFECVVYELGAVDLPSKGLKSPTFTWIVEALGWVDVTAREENTAFLQRLRARFKDNRVLLLKTSSINLVLTQMASEIASHPVGITAVSANEIGDDGRIRVMKSKKPPKLILL